MMPGHNTEMGRTAMTDPDLVSRGGNIADGRGGELFEADIAIEDGRSSEVGKVLGKGKEEINARGKLVAPIFES
jgi:N-acyl-D-aspartate/D-glutamate deacylase